MASTRGDFEPTPPHRPKTPVRNSEDRPSRPVRRAFLVDVVIEGDDERRLEDHAALLQNLGSPIPALQLGRKDDLTASRSRTQSIGRSGGSSSTGVEQGKMDKDKLHGLVKEFIETERRYLQRLMVLKNSYADPLRTFARRSETMIIPLYDAKTLFGNLDTIVANASVFLRDIENIDLSGRVRERGIGDVCLRHFKDLNTFHPYRAYLEKQDESQRTLQAMMKRSSFATFTESVKYQTPGLNNVGIRELVMEPVQRIPRYTLLWQNMIKHMSPRDPQQAKLAEAIELASDIAHCETDDQTKRATLLYCLERTIDGFPANLMSNKRDYVDCIDVDEIFADRLIHRPSVSNFSPRKRPGESSVSTSPERSSGGTLHCTLFLFNDKLLIVKRQSPGISGPEVAGFNDIEGLLSAGGGLAGLPGSRQIRKDRLSAKGVVDILEVIGSDVGDSEFLEFHLFLERPPLDQGERWSARPFRHFSAVRPAAASFAELSRAQADKQRFLRNLWRAQALLRTKVPPHRASMDASQQPVLTFALCDPGRWTPDNHKEVTSLAQIYWNVWNRRSWGGDHRKAKLVVQIVQTGRESPLPLGSDGSGPHVVMRVERVSHDQYTISNMARDSENLGIEQTIVSTPTFSDSVATMVHKYGLFRFRTGPASCPATPTHSYRLRPNMLNLDSISRNLFGNGSASSRSDSMSTSRRSKSTTSRNSTVEDFCFSSETTSTRASSYIESASSSLGHSNKHRQSASLSVVEEKDMVIRTFINGENNGSELDLDMQLSIARQNSIDAATAMSRRQDERARSGSTEGLARRGPLRVINRTPSPQAVPGLQPELQMELRPQPVSPHTRLERDLPPRAPSSMEPVQPLRLTRSRSTSPQRLLQSATEGTASAPPSIIVPVLATEQLWERPRSGYLERLPLPPTSSISRASESPASLGSSHTKLRVVSGKGRRVSATRETAPLKENAENGPNKFSPLGYKRMHSQEEITPRKRSYDRAPLSTRGQTEPPLETAGSSRYSDTVPEPTRGVSDAELARQMRQTSCTTASTETTVHATDPAHMSSTITARADSLREQLAVSCRSSQSIRAEFDELALYMGKDLAKRERKRKQPDLSTSLPRSPPSRKLSRRADFTPMATCAGETGSISSRRSSMNEKLEVSFAYLEEWSTNAKTMVDQLQHSLTQAQREQENMAKSIQMLLKAYDLKSTELETANNRIARATNRNALAQSQINDLQTEVDTVYEAFNTELDGVFEDVQLPGSEAEAALRRNLQLTKAQRNAMQLENIRLRRELQDANLKKEEWAKILKTRGVIP